MTWEDKRNKMEQDRLSRLNIELTSRCNYLCAGCPTSSLSRGKGDIDPDLFYKIFNEVGNSIDKVFLWNYGEPLLHPGIENMIQGIKDYKVYKILSTNGSKLEELPNLTFLTALDELIISLNGLDQKTYNLHQIGGDFDKVVRGIKRVAPYLSNAKTKYVMQVVVHKGNMSLIDASTEFAERNGFDELVLKSFNVHDSSQETFDKFVPFGTQYSRYVEQTPLTKPTKSGKGRGCLSSMVINWNGEVNPCCWDYNGNYILGNVLTSSVNEIWQSEKVRKLRNDILSKTFPSFCVDCAVKPTIAKIKISNKI